MHRWKGMTVEELGQSTPCYIFDLDRFRERLLDLKGKCPQNAALCFAVKANPFLIPAADECVDRFEVCSPGELEICKKYGIAPEKIVFSGINKRKEEILEALQYGVGAITLESLQQYVHVKECAAGLGRCIDVLPRLTNGSQFGMDRETLERILQDTFINDFIRVIGVHYFSGTQKKKTEKILEEARLLLEYGRGLQKHFGWKGRLLEFGAGCGVPYFEGDDFEGEFASFEALADCVGSEGADFCWTLEFGRFLAASCGFYLTSAVDLKENQGKSYCLVDGGIHHLNYYGQNMAMRVPMITHLKNREEREEKKDWCICGSLCTFADVLVRKVQLEGLSAGDVLVFENAGAYSVTEAIGLFLSRKLPRIYFYEKENGMTLKRDWMETSGINS